MKHESRIFHYLKRILKPTREKIRNFSYSHSLWLQVFRKLFSFLVTIRKTWKSFGKPRRNCYRLSRIFKSCVLPFGTCWRANVKLEFHLLSREKTNVQPSSTRRTLSIRPGTLTSRFYLVAVDNGMLCNPPGCIVLDPATFWPIPWRGDPLFL